MIKCHATYINHSHADKQLDRSTTPEKRKLVYLIALFGEIGSEI